MKSKQPGVFLVNEIRKKHSDAEKEKINVTFSVFFKR